MKQKVQLAKVYRKLPLFRAVVVYDKVMEKLANKIADDVVDRILLQIAENKKEEKNSF